VEPTPKPPERAPPRTIGGTENNSSASLGLTVCGLKDLGGVEAADEEALVLFPTTADAQLEASVEAVVLMLILF